MHVYHVFVYFYYSYIEQMHACKADIHGQKFYQKNKIK